MPDATTSHFSLPTRQWRWQFFLLFHSPKPIDADETEKAVKPSDPLETLGIRRQGAVRHPSVLTPAANLLPLGFVAASGTAPLGDASSWMPRPGPKSFAAVGAVDG